MASWPLASFVSSPLAPHIVILSLGVTLLYRDSLFTVTALRLSPLAPQRPGHVCYWGRWPPFLPAFFTLRMRFPVPLCRVAAPQNPVLAKNPGRQAVLYK